MACVLELSAQRRVRIWNVRSKKKPATFLGGGFEIILAATYVPTQLPVQYHRLCGA